jgi:hypothetical protein
MNIIHRITLTLTLIVRVGHRSVASQPQDITLGRRAHVDMRRACLGAVGLLFGDGYK